MIFFWLSKVRFIQVENNIFDRFQAEMCRVQQAKIIAYHQLKSIQQIVASEADFQCFHMNDCKVATGDNRDVVVIDIIITVSVVQLIR